MVQPVDTAILTTSLILDDVVEQVAKWSDELKAEHWTARVNTRIEDMIPGASHQIDRAVDDEWPLYRCHLGTPTDRVKLDLPAKSIVSATSFAIANKLV